MKNTQRLKTIDGVSLPPEIWSAIFMRLPVKSIFRCRFVCKSWNSLISNPTFISDYENQDRSGDRVLLTLLESLYEKNDWESWSSFISHDDSFVNPCKHDHDFPERFRGQWQVVGSCNGLICLRLSKYIKTKGPSMEFLIWNPAIRKIVELPSRTFRNRDRPFKFFYGFGFDSKTSDYKVIFVHEEKCEILDLRKGVWRTIAAPTGFNSWDIHSTNCYLNGAIHSIRRRHGYYGYYEYIILAFDMSEEVFRQITMPNYSEKVTGSALGTDIATFGGLIYVIVIEWDSCSVYAMKEYGVAESWSKLFDIDPKSFQSPSTELKLHTFCFWVNGEVLMISETPLEVDENGRVRKEKHLVLYNLESRKFKRLSSVTKSITNLCSYKESLVLM